MIFLVSEEKKDKIIQAALREFAEHGYEQASTNEIVQEAGVSKGLLFHYFGSKKELFLSVFDYCIKCYEKIYRKYNLHKTSDVLERVLEGMMMKLKTQYQNPVITKLVTGAVLAPPEELETDIKARYTQLVAEYIPKLFEDIDYTLFRDEIDQEKALDILMMSLEAIRKKYVEKYKDDVDQGLLDMDQILAEMKEYVEILKYGLYKRK
ncbi:MAG: TetR/AcrR family transcriptional regulator [Halanaerobiales bacterium]